MTTSRSRGNATVDVLEVVFARAAHDDLILGHVTSLADDAHFEQVFRLLSEAAESTRSPPVA